MSAPKPDLLHQPRLGAFWMTVSLVCFTGNALLLKVLASVRHADPWLALVFRAFIGLVFT